MRSIVRLGLCLALCYGVGFVGGWATAKAIPTWYAGLAKPPWTPPNIAFPIAWNTLYLLMAVSLWLLWDRAAPGPQRARAITLFLVQLLLNFAWPPVFFMQHLIWPAFAIIVALFVVIALVIKAAWPVQRTAAWLLVPYLCWVLYASTLNAGIGILN